MPHELRHTAASLAVSSGANVKAVQRMLGHASAALTLDTYADLFDDDLDAVADRLDDAARHVRGGLRTFCGLETETARTEDRTSRTDEPLTCGFVVCPRQDSNLRTHLRRAGRRGMTAVGRRQLTCIPAGH